MLTLPTLYKRTSTGAIQVWSIGVEKNIIIVNFGQKGGKIQRTEEMISEGKNIGRSNETTPEEQALAEATSKWEGKVKKDYVEDIDRAVIGESDVEGGFKPMLAHKYSDHGHKILFPAYIQPKLNGHRCLAVIENGICTLWSRTRKPITSCPHIIKELQEIYPTAYKELDGELYNHAYKDRFEELASLIRQEEPAENHTEIQYHVYDNSDEVSSFADRIGCLRNELVIYNPLKYIEYVETTKIKDETEMMEKFDEFLALGYEGGMARNAASKYEGKRSYSLQKIKEFQDADYPIVDCIGGRGGYANCGIFVCKAINGELFNVKMRGPKERLKDFLSDSKLWKDKILVVKYQYISKYSIPVFPVGERFKE